MTTNQSTNMFEQAARLQLRFQTSKGMLTVEDLWQLPLTANNAGVPNLDDIAQQLFKKLKQASEVQSFVKPASAIETHNQLHFDIVKRIIDVKMDERDERLRENDRSAKKQQLLALINNKENAQMESLSLEELKKQLEAL